MEGQRKSTPLMNTSGKLVTMWYLTPFELVDVKAGTEAPKSHVADVKLIDVR